MKRKHSIIDFIFFGLGFTSTSPALAIPAGGYISLFSIFWVLCLIILLTNVKQTKDKLSTPQLYNNYIIWLIISVLSSLFGAVYFAGEDSQWQDAALGSIPKVLQYIIVIVLLRYNKQRAPILKSLLYGLLIGMIANIGWAVFDAVGYYLTGVSVNNEIFAGYAQTVGAHFGILSLTYGPTIRATGFNMDPANLGLFIIIVFSYGLRSNNKYLLVLSLLGIFASASMTAVAGILVSLILYYCKQPKKILTAIVFGLFVLGGTYYALPKDNIIVESVYLLMSERIEQKKNATNDSDNQRIVYMKDFVYAVSDMPSSLIIGTGFFTSSYPYIKYGYCRAEEFRPYDPEQTYIATFFDCGLWGFICFMFLSIGSFKKFYKKSHDKMNGSYMLQYAGIEGSLLAFLFYHYLLYSVIMLFTITAVLFDVSEKNEK